MKTTTPILVLAALTLGACEEPTTTTLDDHRAKDGQQDDSKPTTNGVLAGIEVAPISNDQAIAYYTFDTPPSGMAFSTRFGGATIYDDGTEFDEKAGDGIYTGQVPFSVKLLGPRRAAFLERVSQLEEPQLMRFRGHAAVERDSFEASAMPKAGERWVPALGQTLPSFTLFPSTVGASVATLSGLPPTANPRNSLVVTEPAVVRDPTRTGVWQSQGGQCVQVGDPSGPWGIVRLLDEIGNGYVDAHDLTVGLLGELASSRQVNGQTIAPANQGVQTLTDGDPNDPNAIPWPKFFDDNDPAALGDIFDLSQTPVQLIAIVNRTDLAASGYASEQDQDVPRRPELRFVFTFIDEETCEPSLGGFILEYDVPIDDCSLLEDYFTDWHALSSLQVGSPSYNAALEAITGPITTGGAAPGRPNDSNLKVLRTNEANLRFPEYPNDFPSLFQSSWEMQEFAIDPNTHLLVNQPIAQTPAYWYELPDWNDPLHPQEIDDTIAVFQSDILSGQYVVPLTDPLTNDPMLAASAMYGRFGLPQPGRPEYVGFYPPNLNQMERLMSWGSTNAIDVEARQRLSLNTCSGCHFAETFEDSDGPGSFEDVHVGDSTPGGVLEEPFRHIRPDTNLANPAQLSRFMTGTNATCGPDEFVAPLGNLASCSSPGCCPIGDPVFGFEQGQVHYNEFHRRGSILEDVVTNGCGVLDGHQFADVVLSSTH